ncbi:MAG: hypothetical protein HZC03_02020 [Candidatus Lloydbacteria bacterium]|nr:hypothetical protein [Candidatus Lloydbacteria bacterium]
MKNNTINRVFWSAMYVALFLPTIIAHATVVGEGSNRLPNPIAANSFQELIQKILRVVVDIGVPVATLFIIYSGFLFVKAQGNPEKLKEAKETFFWTIIGTAVLLGAWVLAQAIAGTIRSL